MSRTRTWSLAVAAGCALLTVAAWFLLIAPQRAEAADLREQTASQEQTNAATRVRTQTLKAQYAELPAKQAELAVVQRQMPADPDLPSLIRTFTSIAQLSGVQLLSVTPTPPVAVGAQAAAGAPTTLAGAEAAPPAGLLGMTTAIVVQGDFASSTLFLQRLQAASETVSGSSMSRAFLVQSVKVTPSAAPGTAATAPKGQVQMSITGQVFVLAGAPIPTVTIPAAG